MAPIAASLMFACSDYVGEMEDNHSEYQDYIASLESSSSDEDSDESSSSVKKDEEDESSSSVSDEDDDSSSSEAADDDSSSSTAESSSSAAKKTIKCGDLWCGPLDAEGKVEIPGQKGDFSGYWLDYNDNAAPLNGNSRLFFPKDVKENTYGNFYGPLTEAYGGIKAYSQINRKYEYPYAGVKFDIVDDKGTGGNITDWDGICVTYYSSIEFNIILAEEDEASVTEYNNYLASVPKSEKITVIDLPWAKFKQETGWGKKVDQASILEKVAEIRFRFSRSGDFAILSVGRKGSCTIDADYPPAKTLESLASIVTPIPEESSSSVASSSSVSSSSSEVSSSSEASSSSVAITYNLCGDLWCGNAANSSEGKVFIPNNDNELAGYWFDYDDAMEHGDSKLIFPPDVEANNYGNFYGPLAEAYLKITGTAQIGTAAEPGANRVGIGFSVGGEENFESLGANITSWEGFCVAYSSEMDFSVEVSPRDVRLTDYDDPKATLTQSASVKVANFKWTDFSQEGWGKQVDVNDVLRDAAEIKFVFRNSGKFNIFTIGRYGTCGGATFKPAAKKPCGDLWCGTNDTGRKGQASIPLSNATNKAGLWFAYSDIDVGGNSEIVFPGIVTSGDFADMAKKYESITASSKIDNVYEYPFAGIGFNLVDEDQHGGDINDWEGICLAYTSTNSFNIELTPENESNFTEYNNYKSSVPKAASFTVVDIPWSKFKQESGWGVTVDKGTALAQTAAIKLRFSNNNDFMIYTIGRLGTCTGKTFSPVKCGDIWCGTKNAGMKANTGVSSATAGTMYAYSDTDNSYGGNSIVTLNNEGLATTLTTSEISFTPSSNAIDYTVEIGTAYEYPFAGIAIITKGNDEGVNIKDWNGICLSYESEAGFSLELTPEDEAHITEYNNYKANIPKASTRTTTDFYWAKFKQETGWGNTVAQATVLEKIAAIKFKSGKTNSGQNKIYEIGKVGTCTGK